MLRLVKISTIRSIASCLSVTATYSCYSHLTINFPREATHFHPLTSLYEFIINIIPSGLQTFKLFYYALLKIPF